MFLPRNLNFVSKFIFLQFWETLFSKLLRPPSLRFWKIQWNNSFSINIYLKDKLILTVKDWNSIPWITITYVWCWAHTWLHFQIFDLRSQVFYNVPIVIKYLLIENLAFSSGSFRKLSFWPADQGLVSEYDSITNLMNNLKFVQVLNRSLEYLLYKVEIFRQLVLE